MSAISTATEQRPRVEQILKFYNNLDDELLKNYKYFYIQCSIGISNSEQSFWDWGITSSKMDDRNEPDYYNAHVWELGDFCNFTVSDIDNCITEVLNSFIKKEKEKMVAEKLNQIQDDFK
jgi:hypothetical protein